MYSDYSLVSTTDQTVHAPSCHMALNSMYVNITHLPTLANIFNVVVTQANGVTIVGSVCDQPACIQPISTALDGHIKPAGNSLGGSQITH